MQGMLSTTDLLLADIPKLAVEMADELLAELERTK
jgi:hypothetical protein